MQLSNHGSAVHVSMKTYCVDIFVIHFASILIYLVIEIDEFVGERVRKVNGIRRTKKSLSDNMFSTYMRGSLH